MVLMTAMIVALTLATGLAYFRGTYVDRLGTLTTVLMLSVPYIVYVLGMQALLGKLLRYGPVAGFQHGFASLRFIVIPIIIGMVARIGGDVRLYRTFLLDEMSQDYVRTARAKGMPESIVLFRHVLKNALIPIITSAGAYLPYIFLGSLVFESFFGIPGLGAYVIDAITGQDFAIVRTMVFLGSLLYIVSYVLIDIAYTWADPRVRLG